MLESTQSAPSVSSRRGCRLQFIYADVCRIDDAILKASGVVVPLALEKQFENVLGIFLNGLGTMTNILNAHGAATGPTQPNSAAGAHAAYYCKDGPPPPPPPPPPAPAGWSYLNCTGMSLKVWEKPGYVPSACACACTTVCTSVYVKLYA